MAHRKNDRPLWRGRTNVSYVMQQQVEFAEKLRTGPGKGKQFQITQGGFQGGSGDPKSAGTHDKDGCIDIHWSGWDEDIVALRKAGLWAYHRTPAQGPWPDHIHCISLFVARSAMSPAAQGQYDDAKARPPRSGLKGHGPDDGPLVDVLFKWPLPKPTPNITTALKARTREKRIAALKQIVQHGNAASKKAAQNWLDAIQAAIAAEKKAATAKASLIKQEVK